MAPRARLLVGDVRAALQRLDPESVHVCVTSPPYWGLRAYGTHPQTWGGDPTCDHVWGAMERGRRKDLLPADLTTSTARLGTTAAQGRAALEGGNFCQSCGAWLGELGLEPTVTLYVEHVVEVFRQVWRVLRKDGTLWLNLGDCYAGTPAGWSSARYQQQGHDDRTFRDKPFSTITDGLKPKDLAGVPWRVALALQADGWYLRSDIIWAKRNPLPESIRDRPTKAHEYLFLLSKSERYYYDAEAVREPYAAATLPQKGTAYNGNGTKDYAANGVQDPSDTKRRIIAGMEKNGGRNRRTVWSLATEPYAEAHFATFPTKLVEPCLLAGTSAHGCCPRCLAPWCRVTKPTPEYAENFGTNGGADADRLGAGYRKRSPGVTAAYETTGWIAGCKCQAGDPIPCVALDPFAGSGTVLAVAAKHGRDSVGAELLPDYAELARKRITDSGTEVTLDLLAELPPTPPRLAPGPILVPEQMTLELTL